MLVLGAIVFLAACKWFAIESIVRISQKDGSVIDRAGRQRMLSQRICKDALALQLAHLTNDRAGVEAAGKQLDETLVTFVEGHRSLTATDQFAKVASDRLAFMRLRLAEFEQSFAMVGDLARQVRTNTSEIGNPSAERSATVERLLTVSEQYLSSMHETVVELAKLSRQDAMDVRSWSSYGFWATFLLIASTAWLWLAPAATHARREREALLRANRLEEQLSRAQKLESLGQLAAGVAHEINTPMQFVGDNLDFLSDCSDEMFRVVDAYLQLLDELEIPCSWEPRISELKQLAEECHYDHRRSQMPAAIEESREGVRRTVKIVRAMKDFSHPGAVEMKNESLNHLVESTIAISRNRWKHVAEVKLELAADLPDAPMLASEINQVLLNLVVNASDAVASKSADKEDTLGKIVVRTYSDDDHVMVEVQDDGCGIPEEIKSKVFDPFFTTKDVGKGTGQGLAIAHNVVVNMHHGEVDVESTPGIGTTFIVKLPIHGDAASELHDQPGEDARELCLV